MRIFIAALIIAMSPLVACEAAYASASGDIGKPICSHFDDSTKSTARTPADTTAETVAAGAVASAPAGSSTAATSPMSASKGGGSSSMTRTRPAPRWQTFLPGMFR